MSTETSVARWSHVGLNCTVLATTEEFYRRWLGFRRARVIGAEGAPDQVVFLTNGSVYLELFADGLRNGRLPDRDGPRHPGCVRHLAFQVDDVDALLSRMGDQVVRTLGPLRFDEVVEGWYTVWVADPDGVVVEISQGYRDDDTLLRSVLGSSRPAADLSTR